MKTKSFFSKLSIFSAIVVMVVIAGVMAGCQTEESDDFSQKYLSIVGSIDVNSPEIQAIYGEAIQRMDEYVTYRDGQFVLGKVTAARLAMSDELFAQLKANMQQSNEILKDYRGVEIKKNVIRIVNPVDEIPLNRIRTRGLGEDPLPPNSTGYDMRWYGADIYLSSNALITIVGLGAGAVVIGEFLTSTLVGIPEGAIVMLVGGLSGTAAATALGLCPNGIVASFLWVGIAFDFSCQ